MHFIQQSVQDPAATKPGGKPIAQVRQRRAALPPKRNTQAGHTAAEGQLRQTAH